MRNGEAEESQNQRGNLYGDAEILGQREPRDPCDSRQAVQETEIQGEGLGMKCPKCNSEMEYYDHFDEEYKGKEILVRWRFNCPKCNHYSIALATYIVNNVEMEWE